MYRVLIADGDRVAREILAQALSVDVCEIELVSTGEEALRRVVERGVDVLIAEAHLPDMPAWELFAKARQIDVDLLAIAVTEDDSWETAMQVRTGGGPVFFYGLKPLDLGEMQEVVRCAARWRGTRKNPVREGENRV